MGMLIFVLIMLGLTVIPIVGLAVLWTYSCKQEQNEENQENEKSFVNA